MNRRLQGLVASRLFALKYQTRPVSGERVLMYHSVAGQSWGDSRGTYGIGRAAFAEQIKSLASWRLFSLADSGCFSKRKDSTAIAVSFDDGYKTVLYQAAPLLAGAGIPFTVFIPTGWVGSVPTVMNKAEIRELLKFPGVTVGSHGVRHIRLTEATPVGLEEELAGSRAFLEDLSGQTVDLLSYPYGACDQRVAQSARNAGYRLAFTSRFGVNTPQSPRMFLRRTDIWATDTSKAFLEKISGAWDWRGFLGR